MITMKFQMGRARGAIVLLALLAMCGGSAGCESRFTTRTDYLAPGFNRGSLRGRTVAVLPAAAAEADAAAAPGADAGFARELAGVTRGISEAGARVRVVTPAAAPVGAAGSARTAAYAVDFGGGDESEVDPTALRDAARRYGRGVDAAYMLFVRVTDAEVYQLYAPPRGADSKSDWGSRRSTESRTSGRRVGLRLTLLRLPDGAPAWAARGSGVMWNTRNAAPAGAAGSASSLEDDLRLGNSNLYPEPPRPEAVARQLVRRMLARVPFPPELEPN